MEIEENFCIKLHSQEQLDTIISFYKNKGYIEKGDSHKYKKGYFLHIKTNEKTWQTDILNSRYYPIKTIEELSITPKFEVGKWYKWLWKVNKKVIYGKIDIISENSFDVLEGIHNNVYSKINGYFYKDCENLKLLTDLSEIQQYLPEEHPDRILYERGYDIFGNNTAPEYVEYIDTKYKGQIVRVIKWSASSYCEVIFSDGNKEQPFKHLVKLSTKEEYDAQNQPKSINMKEIQEECKKRFPIGCTFINTQRNEFVLKDDEYVYTIHNDMIYASDCYGCLYENGKYAELVSLTKESIQDKKYDYEVVHCTTQEEWDFVTEKLGYKWENGNFNEYKNESCIDIKSKSYLDLSFCNEYNSLILSFDEWCNKFNHKPNFKEKPMETYNSEFKVGDYVITKGYSRSYDGRVLKISKINNIYVYFQVLDKGYHKINDNFNINSILQKAKLEEIPTKNLSNEEILEIAKQYYPIGTQFENLYGSISPLIIEENNHLLNTNNSGDIICVTTDKGNGSSLRNSAAIWSKEKGFAKIISYANNCTLSDIDVNKQFKPYQWWSESNITFDKTVKINNKPTIIPVKVRNVITFEQPKRTKLTILKTKLI